MKTWLMNSTMFTRPVFAPPREGGGGGEGSSDEGDGDGDFLSDEDLADDDFDTGPLYEEGSRLSQDDEIIDDKPDFLSRFWGDDDDEEGDDEGEEEDAGDSPEQQAALREKMQGMINGLVIGEDAIPDDFDPTDRKALRNLLAAVQRDTVQKAIQVMMLPVGAGFRQAIVRMRQESREESRGRINRLTQRNELQAEIPIYRDPRYRRVVSTLLEQGLARTNGNRKQAIIATRKALKAMDINPDGVSASGKRVAPSTARGGVQAARNRTNDVLSLFAPLPEPNDKGGKQSQQNSLRNRLKGK